MVTSELSSFVSLSHYSVAENASNTVCPCIPSSLADFMSSKKTQSKDSAWQSTRTLQVIVILTEIYGSITSSYTVTLHIFLPAVELYLASEVLYANAFDRTLCDY